MKERRDISERSLTGKVAGTELLSSDVPGNASFAWCVSVMCMAERKR
jgi:hypothetical protein